MATYARWNRSITDGSGNALNATVTVYKESDGLLATIYDDRAGATPKSNPFTLSSADQGYAYFHAVGGAYKVVATYGSYTQTWRYEPVGTGAEFDAGSLSGVQAPTTTVPAAVQIAEATNNGSNYIQITVPAALSANYTFTLPAADVTMSTYAATLIAAASASAARTTLGLGTSAVIDTGTSGTKVALTDGANTWSAAQTLSAALNLTSGQIAFPASQSASGGANTLDDYEEGSFTPGMTFNGSATGVTYSAQSGVYVKVGQLVFFDFTLTLTNNGSGTGAAKFTGLPFTNVGFPSPCDVHLVTGGSSASGIYAMVDASATTATVYIPGATGASGATDTNCTNTFDVRVSGVYQATA